MATVIPIDKAGTIQNYRFDRVWTIPGSLIALAAPEIVPPSAASLETNGEPLRPALGSSDIKGIPSPPSIASIDAGETSTDTDSGAMDTGLYSPFDPAPGSMDVSGIDTAIALATLAVGNYPSLSGFLIYLSLAALDVVLNKKAPAPGSYDTVHLQTAAVDSGLAVRGQADANSRADFEIGSKTALPSQASLDHGELVDAESLASVDSVDGEGVDFLIDIQDSILASGHVD